jgi:UDP-N-acetylmuramyl pentapeptide synthase
VAVVNNAQREHQEFMQSVEAVAQENGAVFSALNAKGVAVFPAQDAHAHVWRNAVGKRSVLEFGLPDSAVHVLKATWADFQWHLQIQTPAGEITTTLNLAGQHNLHNGMAAVACAVAVGVPLNAVAQGLAQFQAVTGRSRAMKFTWAGEDKILVDDSYNANPDSVRAAIDLLAQSPGPRLLVLGDMGEVGDQGPAFHAEIGAYAQLNGIEHLFTLGELSVHATRACQHAQHFDHLEDLMKQLKAVLPQLHTVLVKGSRFMRMERVVQALQTNPAADLSVQEATCC